jgi:hypothetical protein
MTKNRFVIIISLIFFFTEVRGAAINSAYHGYPELWILWYPAQRYHANPWRSGWESDILTARHDAPLISQMTNVSLSYWRMYSLFWQTYNYICRFINIGSSWMTNNLRQNDEHVLQNDEYIRQYDKFTLLGDSCNFNEVKFFSVRRMEQTIFLTNPSITFRIPI